MPASNIGESRLSLPANLTLRTITDVHQDLLQFMETHQNTVIGFAENSQFDISLVQLLEAARIYAGTGGKSVALAEPAGGALLDVLRRSGFLEGMSAADAQFWLHQGEIQ
jgi:hypothetical protein